MIGTAMSDSTVEISNIKALMAGASVEMTCKDVEHLAEAAKVLPAGTDIFIALFPNQTFEELTEAARAVGAAGFTAVPHVPARRVKDVAEVTKIAQGFAGAGVKKMLLIAGDMTAPEGAFDSTIGVLASGEFAKAGIKTMYMAGHPEGHAHMTVEQQREYEQKKVALTAEQGVDLTFVTQVVFEPEPFVEWENTLRKTGAGASMRALMGGGKMALVANLLGDSGPEETIRTLAREQAAGKANFSGLHFFAFGGFLKTAKFVAAIQNGNITLDSKGEAFKVHV
jgi:methylenetetrahydrofolate reductase (NADPH)